MCMYVFVHVMCLRLFMCTWPQPWIVKRVSGRYLDAPQVFGRQFCSNSQQIVSFVLMNHAAHNLMNGPSH
jgi:hypothetical protein